jgi:hypothetical protein
VTAQAGIARDEYTPCATPPAWFCTQLLKAKRLFGPSIPQTVSRLRTVFAAALQRAHRIRAQEHKRGHDQDQAEKSA